MSTFRLGSIALSLATAGVLVLPGGLSAQKDPKVLKRAELLQSAQRSKDLYEAIRSLRPNFLSPLTTRTQASSQSRAQVKPVVYIDGAFSGELEVLHSILVDNVEEVRFLSPSEAAVTLTPSPPGGAIMVTTHKDPNP